MIKHQMLSLHCPMKCELECHSKHDISQYNVQALMNNFTCTHLIKVILSNMTFLSTQHSVFLFIFLHLQWLAHDPNNSTRSLFKRQKIIPVKNILM